MAALELRPLSLGELLDRTFFLYRRHFLLFVGIAGIPYLFVLVPALLGLILYGITGHTRPPSSGLGTGVVTGMAAILIILIIVIVVLFIIAALYSAGAAVFAVSEIYAGRQPSIRGSFRMVRGKAGTIIGVMLLSGLILMGGFIALIIPGLYLLCRIPVAMPAAMIEDIGPGDSIGRSFHLTRDFAGRAALIYILAVSLTYGVGFLLQAPFFVLAAVSAKGSQLMILWTALAQVGNLLGGILVAPVHTIGFALFYYDLRVRKEAFDLQMMMQAIGADPAPPPITGGTPPVFGRDAS
jgi:hypothetical protein